MTAYLANLERRVDCLVYHLINSTSQWVNKPKIHMLLHLAESIRRFGPASLCSTEKFESYNGVLRKASVHSNKQAPGRDVAISFESYASLRFILSEGVIYDHTTGCEREIGPNVTSFFAENKSIQLAMRYNAQSSREAESSVYPKKTLRRLPKDNKMVPPPELISLDGGPTVTQVSQVQLDRHNTIDKGSFVAVGQAGNSDLEIGIIKSLWEVRTVNAKFFHGTVNVQHNCHGGKCLVDKYLPTRKECQATQGKCWAVQHSDMDNYILNSASLHEPQLHEQLSALPTSSFSPNQWRDCIDAGHQSWLGGAVVMSDAGGDSSDEDVSGPGSRVGAGGPDEGNAYADGEDQDDEGEEEDESGSCSDDSEGSSQDEDAEGETDDGEEYDWGDYEVHTE
ncbi:uncharacterized protein PGTG_20974 [Puccinia graminis f. sp. tritici CRL 75-36-700-3]|uniref:Uncharacterized protein n=1 Tax=Puccinia graminis f. sp. tritici (strain CRL 75-36-700-3 / race SCCL) TaxID=418459 RepID=H6QPY9_PUCGT|nr:uncharacterized protein PGTG_20974 [Puccinia graminis f. sp. tritici CRL 75-36-700-3]EHS64512.1 hypothetical protein PGTG_20974 [Puccinia graminis f. sp. tritici CRL 75-36-700-3]